MQVRMLYGMQAEVYLAMAAGRLSTSSEVASVLK